MVRVRVRSGRVDLHKTRVGSRVNLYLLRVKKIGFGSDIFWVGSENSDPFYHVYPWPPNPKGKTQISPFDTFQIKSPWIKRSKIKLICLFKPKFLLNVLCTFPIEWPAASGIDVSLWSSISFKLLHLVIAVPAVYLSLSFLSLIKCCE